MKIDEQIKEFIRFCRETAEALAERGVEQSSFRDDEAGKFSGWTLERGDFPTTEDINTDRRPIYMGGSWGNWEMFLGADGIIYRHEFRGEEEYSFEKEELVSSQSHCVRKMTVKSLMGTGAPFAKVRRQLQAKIADSHEW